MPELPEVQTVVNDLIRHSIEGKRVVKVAVFWPRSIAEPSVDLFGKMIEGQVIKRIERRGRLLAYCQLLPRKVGGVLCTHTDRLASL